MGNCETCGKHGLLYYYFDHWDIKHRLCHNCYLKAISIYTKPVDEIIKILEKKNESSNSNKK